MEMLSMEGWQARTYFFNAEYYYTHFAVPTCSKHNFVSSSRCLVQHFKSQSYHFMFLFWTATVLDVLVYTHNSSVQSTASCVPKWWCNEDSRSNGKLVTLVCQLSPTKWNQNPQKTTLSLKQSQELNKIITSSIKYLPSVLWRCWLGGRKCIQPVKTERWGTILAWTSVWNEVPMICIWSSWCHCHLVISCSSKIHNGLRFWCQLTQVVLEKGR